MLTNYPLEIVHTAAEPWSAARHKFATHAAAARSMGLSAGQGQMYRNLTKLDADQQEQVLSGQVEQHTVNRLSEVANLEDDEERRARFAELIDRAPSPRDVKLSVTSSRAEPPLATSRARRAVPGRCAVWPTSIRRSSCGSDRSRTPRYVSSKARGTAQRTLGQSSVSTDAQGGGAYGRGPWPSGFW